MNIFTSLTMLLFTFIHPIKLTTGKLQYFPSNKTIELTENFFLDDFESALKKKYKIPALDISNSKALARKIVQDYTSSRLSIRVNNKECLLVLTDLVIIEKNVLQAKYSISEKVTSKIESIDVSNQLLFEAYDDQVNILHIVIPDEEKVILRFMPFEYHKTIAF
jgi:hypothetical protein